MSKPLFGNDVLFAQRFLKSAGFYQGRLDGIWGPLTDEAQRAFDTQSLILAGQLGTFDEDTEGNVRTLHLQVQAACRVFLKAVSSSSFDVRVLSGTRTYAEQDELYRIGRDLPGEIITNARGGESNHNFGLAWDIGVF